MAHFDPTQHRTSKLFQLASGFLLSGQVADARQALDELCRRPDHIDPLCSPETYVRRCDRVFSALIRDRVRAANSVAEYNRAVRSYALAQAELTDSAQDYDRHCA